MHYHNSRELQCHHVSNIAEADWSIADPAGPMTFAGRHVVRQYNINPTIADVVAHLAGLGLTEEVH